MKRIKYLLGNLTMINFALFFFFAALLFSFLTSEETVYPLLSEVRMFYESSVSHFIKPLNMDRLSFCIA